MSVTLLVLAAAASPDLAFDAYARCAQGAAAAYKGATDSLEAIVGRVAADCARDRTALLEAAPDKGQAAEWIRMTTTQAVTEQVPGLRSAPAEPKEGQIAAVAPASSRYPKLEAYRLCGVEQAARTAAERPYNTPESIATDATARCETLLKAAADETAAEMRQPRLRQQVMIDFRRRSVTELTQKINELRVGKK